MSWLQRYRLRPFARASSWVVPTGAMLAAVAVVLLVRAIDEVTRLEAWWGAFGARNTSVPGLSRGASGARVALHPAAPESTHAPAAPSKRPGSLCSAAGAAGCETQGLAGLPACPTHRIWRGPAVGDGPSSGV